MTFIKRYVEKHPSFWRYTSVILILSIIFPTIFATAFGGEIGRIIGFSIFSLIAIYGMFETLRHLKLSKISALYLSLLTMVVFILPFETTKSMIINPNWSYSLHVWFSNSFGWNVLIIFCASLLPFSIEVKLWKNKGDLIKQMGIAMLVVILMPIFAKATWMINCFDYTWVIYFLSIAIVADSFGYFGGRYFGKYFFKGKKLAPSLSPKKTWGGFIVGYIFTAVFIGVLGYYMDVFHGFSNETLILVTASITLPIISPMGDLAFSGIKRYLKIKDFSNLIPGHGGVLDRVDAMSFVMLVVTLIFIIG